MKYRTRLLFTLMATISLVACSPQQQADGPFEARIIDALDRIGLKRETLILPKVPYPIATKARLPLVDASLKNPPVMIDVTRDLLELAHESTAGYIEGLLQKLDIPVTDAGDTAFSSPPLQEVAKSLGFRQGDAVKVPPQAWQEDTLPALALRSLLHEATLAHRAWLDSSGTPKPEEQQQIQQHILQSQQYRGVDPNVHRLLVDAYHSIGEQQDLGLLLGAVLRLLDAAGYGLDAFRSNEAAALVGEWETPMGTIRIAGTGDDTHSGRHLLLIDLGGNDTYTDVGQPLTPGNTAIVIDLSGDDTVTWEKVQGPGSGLLGIGLWMDLAGNDTYRGHNSGIGTGLLGAGMLIDAGGDDTYEAVAHSQGSGQYGAGILLDQGGNDSYTGALHAQGYGGPGGVGMLVDQAGDDDYLCKALFADPTKKRAARHEGVHYLNMCQGYAFGIREDISGGIGLLLDHTGNDRYKADIFGQGASYWFGLGLLVDGDGDDVYEAFEHAQGEGLHLSAGILADWSGNDSYTGYEHVQGVGMDRAAGILYDHAGNDSYEARRESQGAGLKSYGVGLLIENAGDDSYKALTSAQGYSGKPEPGFPESEWPTGILLDIAGKDSFEVPYTEAVNATGRIQNKQGIAIDYAP